MRQLRTALCIFSVIAAFLALAQHLGFDLWNCASCSSVNQIPISGVIAWLGPIILCAVTFGIYTEAKWSKIGLITASIGSLTLVGWMIIHSTICLLCMLVHIGVISSAMSLIPRPKIVGLVFFSLAVSFTATGGWERFMVSGDIGIFRPREGEVVPSGKVYVLFTDPECSRCQMLENDIAKLTNPPHILYRWSLLPQSMYRSIRVASALEMARMQSPRDFERFQECLRKTPMPLTDDKIVGAATEAGLGSKVNDWLDNPSEQTSIAIEADQATAQELKIQSLPALAELSEPDATGMRTLRLVPVASIGIN